MNELHVHRVNFFKPEAKAIHSLACDQQSKYLAVLRADSLIEVWNLNFKPYLEKVIPGEPPNSIECLGWYNGRLFSGGLHGKIVEYDQRRLIPELSAMVPVGGGVWCMNINKSQLAVGTENGFVTIYEISSGLDFVKTLNKQEGRILCIAWHESGSCLVTGSIDTIRIFDVKTGTVTDRIIIGRSEKKIETIVWCLAVTKDMIIISGDSCGKTSFWDGKTTTLISSSTTHKADVLTLRLSKDENTVYSSGVDPLIIMHIRSRSSSDQRQNWMKSVQRNIHSHDVRALELCGDYLISGGVDTYLTFSKFPPKTVISYCPFSCVSYCCVSQNFYVLLKYSQYFEIWKLGNTSAESNVDGEHLPLNSNPVCLVKMNCKSEDVVISFAISSDARWVAYSTVHTIKLFQITLQEDSIIKHPVIQKVKALPFKEVCAARCLAFIEKEKETFLFSVTTEGKLRILLCDLSCPEYKVTFNPEDLRLSGSIHLMKLGSNNRYIALGTHDGNVSIFNYESGKVHCLLPLYRCQPTAMEFDTDCKNLIVAYNDRRIIEFDIEKKAYSIWSSRQDFTEFQESSFYPIQGVVLPSINKNYALIYDNEAIYRFDRSEKNLSPTKRKKLKNGEQHEYSKVTKPSYKIISKFKHLLEFKTVNENEVLALEVKPSHIQSCLPPTLQRKLYGT